LESTQVLKTSKHERKQAILDWLHSTCGINAPSLEVMAGDASLRRYFRLYTASQSLVVMDAPPPVENCRPYIAIAKALRQQGLHAPEVLHADVMRGFLVISDLGDATYLSALTETNSEALYGEALSALATLQAMRCVEGYITPAFTAHFMRQEWVWHKEWVWNKLLGLSLPLAEKTLDACNEVIIESAVSQPQVFMHRDYHSANLMVLPEGGVGILDFQDAFIGPLTYDVVSLLRDCYTTIKKDEVEALALSYLHRLHDSGEYTEIDEQTFLRWFDLMGVQRHLKAMMTFARKAVRDHEPRYLTYIPRTLQYLTDVTHRYPELAVLHDYLRVTVQPAFERIMK